MIINNYVSIKTIIESVYINAGYQVVPWNDALEYTGRIIALLGINAGYVDKIATVEVVDYKGVLPCDAIYVKGVRDYKTKITLIPSTDVYALNPKPNEVTTFGECYPEGDYSQLQCPTYDELVEDELARTMFYRLKQSYDNEMLLVAEHANINNNRSVIRPTYFIQAGIINTNVKDGTLEIVYAALPTDSEGFPLIPDNEYYKRAIEMYIQERIDYKLWRQGKINDKIYQHTQKEYMWAVRSAQSNCNTPSPDEMETIKNSYMRLITDMRAHQAGFKFNTEVEKYYGGR